MARLETHPSTLYNLQDTTPKTSLARVTVVDTLKYAAQDVDVALEDLLKDLQQNGNGIKNGKVEASEAKSDIVLPHVLVDEAGESEMRWRVQAKHMHTHTDGGEGPYGTKTATPLSPQDIQNMSLLDESMILGMERTLFSSLQLWIAVIMFGTGLMMTGAHSDRAPDWCGLGFIVTATICLVISWGVHVTRLMLLNTGHTIGMKGSAAWTLLIVVVLVGIIAVELHFALRYPYLERSQVVAISSSP